MTDDPVIALLRAGFFASPLMRELMEDAKRQPYPESSAKRHHLVPRFLLARFVRPGSPHERIMQLDVRKGRTDWVDPARAASRTRFYRLTDDDGTVHQRFEHFLSRVESHAAEAIRRMCADPGALTAPDRATIAMFLALLAGRTMAGLEQLTELADLTLQTAHASRSADPVAFAEDYREAIGPADADTIEQFRQEMLRALERGDVRLANPKEVAIDLLLEHSSTSAQHLFQMHWQMLEAPEGGFVMSDRGLAMFDPTPPYPWAGHAILSSPRAETTIPLDPSRCLLIRPLGAPVTAPEIPAQAVDADGAMAINLRTYGFASQYLFAATQEDAIGVRREAKARPREVERPRPFRQVMLIDAEPGDDRLADEHRRKGWPARLAVDGELHDYVVLDPNDRPVERSVDLSVLGKQRAVRRLGSDEVRERTISLDPAQMRPA